MPFSVSGTTSTSNAYQAQRESASAESSQVMGKDDFLRLLTVQLKYQDPINPINDQDFIAQLAQFSSLEQMQNLSDRLSQYVGLQMMATLTSQAVSLLGRTVRVQGAEEEVTGVVQSIRFNEGEPWLIIDNESFRLADVIEVE